MAGGTKEPAITVLLERTLDRRAQKFEPLIEAVIRNGLTNRQQKGDPIRRVEVETINRLLLNIGFRFPQLWDEDFLRSLSADTLEQAQETHEQRKE